MVEGEGEGEEDVERREGKVEEMMTMREVLEKTPIIGFLLALEEVTLSPLLG